MDGEGSEDAIDPEEFKDLGGEGGEGPGEPEDSSGGDEEGSQGSTSAEELKKAWGAMDESGGDLAQDTEVEGLRTGIPGFDKMVPEGIPKKSLIAVLGGAGTGKTTFGLHFLYQGLEKGEKAVYITIEESEEAVRSTAVDKNMDFPAYEESGDLVIVDLEPDEMASSLQSIRGDLPRMLSEFDADRMVMDSISHLEMMFESKSERRNQVYRFSRSLKETGVTTLVTSEADRDNAYSSRYNIIEYTSDAVVVLRYVRTEQFSETRTAVEIQKIRNADHSREIRPYEISDEGIQVHSDAPLF